MKDHSLLVGFEMSLETHKTMVVQYSISSSTNLTRTSVGNLLFHRPTIAPYGLSLATVGSPIQIEMRSAAKCYRIGFEFLFVSVLLAVLGAATWGYNYSGPLPLPQEPSAKYSVSAVSADVSHATFKQPGCDVENGATYYFLAVAGFGNEESDVVSSLPIDEWRATKITELPIDVIVSCRDRLSSRLKYLEKATQKVHCQWPEVVDGHRDESDVQSIAQLALLKIMEARCAMAQAKFEDAAISIMSCIKVGTDLSGGPTEEYWFSAYRVIRVSIDALNEFVQLENAPNLYWWLQAIERPVISIVNPFYRERLLFESRLPNLDRLVGGYALAEDEIIGIFSEWESAQGDLFEGGSPKDNIARQLSDTSLLAEPKSYLAGAIGSRVVDAMPASQVLIAYRHRKFVDAHHRAARWTSLPWYQGHQKFAEDLSFYERSWVDFDSLISDGALIDTVGLSWDERWFLGTVQERRIAALIVVESLRDYLARNRGQFGAEFDLTKLLPVPNDPLNGLPFTIHLDESTQSFVVSSDVVDIVRDFLTFNDLATSSTFTVRMK